jgi:hypothetical protein
MGIFIFVNLENRKKLLAKYTNEKRKWQPEQHEPEQAR